MEPLSAWLSGMDVVDAIRAFYILATCTTLTVSAIPSFHSRFVLYGARATGDNNPPPPPPSQSAFSRFLDYLASWKVPHRYFTHYYLVSVLCSAFWMTQLLTRGPAFRAIAAHMSDEHLQKAMSIQQVLVCVILIAVQGGRRLYECMVFAKLSSSQMWFVHWLLGIAFYVATSVAVWIEGTGSLLSKTLTLDDVRITTVPSLKTLVGLPLFLMASGVQHDCHHYLASLKKYAVPSHPLFLRVLCPHYTAECVIYLSLALLAAPQGEVLNKTLLCTLLFVVVNLGITAGNSKRWYIEKFGEESVRGRWRMIPGIY